MIGANLAGLLDTQAPPQGNPTPIGGPDPVGVGPSSLIGAGIAPGIAPGTGLPQPTPVAAPPRVPIPGAGGWAKYKAWKQGPDIYSQGIATQSGGTDSQGNPNDKGDNSRDPNGNLIGNKEMTVSIARGTIPGTKGGPFENVPPGTQVEITRNGKKVIATVKDDGPAYTDLGATDDDGKPGIMGSAMADLSPMVARSLGFGPNDSGPVSMRLINASQHVKPNAYNFVPPNADEYLPADKNTLGLIGDGLSKARQKDGTFNVDALQSLIDTLQSGSLRNNFATHELSGYLDTAQNEEDTNKADAKIQFQKAVNLFRKMQDQYDGKANLGNLIDPIGILGLNNSQAPQTRGDALGAALAHAVAPPGSSPTVIGATMPQGVASASTPPVLPPSPSVPPPGEETPDTPDTPMATSVISPNVPMATPNAHVLPSSASILAGGQPQQQFAPMSAPQIPQVPTAHGDMRQYLASLGDQTQDPEYPQLAQSKALLAQKLAAVNQARNDLAGLDIPDKPAPRDYTGSDALKAGLLALPSLFLKGRAGTSWLANSLSGYANAHNKDLDTSDQRDYQKAYAQKQAALQNASQDAQSTQQDIQDINGRINHRQQLQNIALHMENEAKKTHDYALAKGWNGFYSAKTPADVDAATSNIINLGFPADEANSYAQAKKATLAGIDQRKTDAAKVKLSLDQMAHMNNAWMLANKSYDNKGGITQAAADQLNTLGRRDILSNMNLLPSGFNQMSHADKMAELDKFIPPAQVGQTIAAQGLPSQIALRGAQQQFLQGPRTNETNAQTGHLNALTDLTKANTALTGLKSLWLPYLDQATIDHIGAGIENQYDASDQHNLTGQLAASRALYSGANAAMNRIVASHLGVPKADDKDQTDYKAYQAASQSANIAKQNVDAVLSAMANSRGKHIGTLPPIPSQPPALKGSIPMTGPIGSAPKTGGKVRKTSKGTKYRVIP